MSYLQTIFGNNVKKYREYKGFTQETLGEKVGLTFQNLSRVERGVGFVTSATYEKLCEVLEINPEQLVEINDALPEKIINQDDIKPLLHSIVRDFDEDKAQALYKLVLAFLEMTK